MRSCSAVLIALAMKLVGQTHAPLLVIYRDFIKPGNETAYSRIEQDNARLMREAAPVDSERVVRFPNPYLAVEPLTGSKELWFLTTWNSRGDYDQVGKEYSKAPKALIEALERNAKARADLTLPPMSVFTTYRKNISSGKPWMIGRSRYLVIAMTKTRSRPFEGSVYEADDHTYFVIRSVKSRSEAEAIAGGSPEARVFAVRPNLSRPASEWVAVDQEFWVQTNNAK